MTVTSLFTDLAESCPFHTYLILIVSSERGIVITFLSKKGEMGSKG